MSDYNFKKKIGGIAIKTWSKISDKLDLLDARMITQALIKLDLLEQQGFNITNTDYDYVNHPLHYQSNGKECIDEMVSIWGAEKVADFCDMNAFKYNFRKGNKPNATTKQDEAKAEWYLNKAKELRYDQRRNS